MTGSNEQYEELRYKALGEFIAKFELMVEVMRALVVAILMDNGLTSMRMAYATTGKLHASEIREILMSLTYEWFDEHPDETMMKVGVNTLLRIQKLLPIRNTLAHGYTTHLPSDDFDLDTPIGGKWKHTKTGLGREAMPSINLLHTQIEEVWQVTSNLLLLQSFVNTPETRLEISDGMIFDSTRQVYYHKNSLTHL